MTMVLVTVSEKQPGRTSPWALTSKCLSLQKHNLVLKIRTSVLHWQVTSDNFFLYCCYSHNPVLRQTVISCLQRNFRFRLGLATTWLYAGNLLRTPKYKISYSPYKNSHLNAVKLKKIQHSKFQHIQQKNMWSNTPATSEYKPSNN